jgi:hypothetical protein
VSSVELRTGRVGTAEEPPSRRDVVSRDFAAIVGPELERQALPVEVGVDLPVGAPVAAHGHPPDAGALDPPQRHHATAADVGDRHQLEVAVAADGDAAAALAGHPAVVDGHDAGLVHGDGLPRWLRHVEVAARRVAPAAVVAGERPVGRAQVGGRHGDGGCSGPAPHGLARVAGDGEAGAAHGAVVEQRGAQRRRPRAVPGVVQVAVPARATHGARSTHHRRRRTSRGVHRAAASGDAASKTKAQSRSASILAMAQLASDPV